MSTKMYTPDSTAHPQSMGENDTMTEQSRRTVGRWLYVVSVLIVALVIFGGYVRLTRSGLSIVEWNVIRGILPPLGEGAWIEEFAKYQQTPEFQKINTDMTLPEYKRIFYLEYIHRLVARLAGLVVVLPLGYYLLKGIIPRRRSGVYILIALLFAFQGFMGWYMVSSGLRDRPAVSHYRLTIHLFLALLLLAITLWTALNLSYAESSRRRYGSTSLWLSITLTVTLIVQILYGGLVAGLKAGHVSATWPLMFGYLVPPGLLSALEPWWRNLLEAESTVHFTHRWFAWAVFIVTALLFVTTKRRGYSLGVERGLTGMMVLVGIQIVLGISVIWFYVPLVLALSHQAMALLLFVIALFLTHRIMYEAKCTMEQPELLQ